MTATDGRALVVVDRRAMTRGDREFLPGAMQILETPASPITSALTFTICALVVVSMAWTWFGRIDIIASASGKFQPTGRVKVIQPVETGKVVAIHAGNGSRVAAGDVLVTLDGTEALAEETALAGTLSSLKAERLRRLTALADLAAARYADPVIDWPSDTPKDLRQREDRVLVADLRQLQSNLSSLGAQLDQKKAEADSLVNTVKAESNLIATLQDRVDMKTTLVAMDAGTKASLLDATETLRYQFTTLATQQGQLAQARVGCDVLVQEIAKTRDAFASENSQKLADVERLLDETAQKLVKAKATTGHMVVRSPVSGVVQASMLTTVGQVVTTGSEMMRVVPADSALEIEAYVQNADVGFIGVGQEATVKVASFPFTQYGTLHAHVTRVATDAVPEPDARAIENGSTKIDPPGLFGGTQKTQDLVFPITLVADRATIDADGHAVPLGAGMSVNVEIKTGRRRILEYLFSPLVEVASEALSER